MPKGDLMKQLESANERLLPSFCGIVTGLLGLILMSLWSIEVLLKQLIAKD